MILKNLVKGSARAVLRDPAGSDKLLKFRLSLGQEERTASDAKYHDPGVGRAQGILFTNLARKISVMSEGMLLSAENPDGSQTCRCR